MNGELRSEGQAIWTLLGGILGQVWLPFLSVHTSPSSSHPAIAPHGYDKLSKIKPRVVTVFNI